MQSKLAQKLFDENIWQVSCEYNQISHIPIPYTLN